ncbi:ribonuclease III [Candidatus Falkowbacteria bacterium]|nr:ribonuclease III [Candidatus Falkowbacteria bacterium]
MAELKKLEEKIGIDFKNPNLLKQSMVHRSYLNEHHDFSLGHNERLEFLGDAVLEIVVTEHLFENYPDEPEGELTNWRASLVNAKMLSKVANELKVEEHLFLSRGEAKDKDSKARQYILADSIEALIGAIYLDQGIKKAEKFVVKFILSKLDNILENKLYYDPKSRFQEIAQEKYGITPHYKVLSETGPDHKKVFEVGLYLGAEFVTKAKGSSKQEAQVESAKKGLEKKKW